MPFKNKKGHIKVLKADTSLIDKEGWTNLHKASWERHLKTVKLLIEKGAQVDAKMIMARWPCISQVCGVI